MSKLRQEECLAEFLEGRNASSMLLTAQTADPEYQAATHMRILKEAENTGKGDNFAADEVPRDFQGCRDGMVARWANWDSCDECWDSFKSCWDSFKSRLG